jgi:hypothetical protein
VVPKITTKYGPPIEGRINNILSSLHQSFKPQITTGLESSPSADYTFMVYMIGSDLESRSFAATNNTLQMEKVGSTPNVNVIIETGGGSNQTKIDGKRFIDFTKVQRHKILHNGIQTLSNLGKQDMADPKTLSDFIVWGMSKFPAKKYAIIHGSGTNGFGKDLQFKNDILNASEMQYAFAETNKITHKKFEIIGFDACLMSSIEIADMIQPFGEYMISSEEVEPSWGWNYTAILESLAKFPLQNGSTVGKVAADSYLKTSQAIALSEKYGADKQIMLSVINLTRVPQVTQAVDALSTYLTQKTVDTHSSVYLAKSDQLTERYGIFVNGSTGLVDLYDLSSHLIQRFPQSESLVDNVQSALNNTIVYKIHGDAKPNSNGLSIYLPIQKEGFMNSNRSFNTNAWQKLLNLQYAWLDSDKKPIAIETVLDGNIIRGIIIDSDVSTFALNAYIKSNRGPIIVNQDMDPSVAISTNGTFNYNSKDLKILSLCNEQNICIPLSLKLDINSDKKIGLIPVDIKSTRFPDIIKASLIFDIDDKGNYIFLGYAPETNTEVTISKTMYSLLPKDQISTSFPFAENSSRDVDFGLIVNGTDQLKIEYKQYTPYAMNFRLCDYSNNCESSRLFNLVNKTSKEVEPLKPKLESHPQLTFSWRFSQGNYLDWDPKWIYCRRP